MIGPCDRCGRVRKYRTAKRNLCHSCYDYHQRTGEFAIANDKCTVCGGAHYALGLCRTHYRQAKRESRNHSGHDPAKPRKFCWDCNGIKNDPSDYICEKCRLKGLNRIEVYGRLGLLSEATYQRLMESRGRRGGQ